MNRSKLNDETRLALKTILNDESNFKKACRLFDRHKSVSLIEAGLVSIVKETLKPSENFLDNLDVSAIVREFKEEN